MATLRHHRRNHSWPHCRCSSNSKLCTCEAQTQDLRKLVSKHASSSLLEPYLTFEKTNIRAPIFLEHMTDDVEMAGIDRSPPRSPRLHRVWSQEPTDPDDEIMISAIIEPQKNSRRNIFRRLIRRPPLDRTRSALTIPNKKISRWRISRWISPRARPYAKPTIVVTDVTWAALPTLQKADSTPNLVPEERPHKRTHSERPRSWTEPSAGLWTLEEED